MISTMCCRTASDVAFGCCLRMCCLRNIVAIVDPSLESCLKPPYNSHPCSRRRPGSRKGTGVGQYVNEVLSICKLPSENRCTRDFIVAGATHACYGQRGTFHYSSFRALHGRRQIG